MLTKIRTFFKKSDPRPESFTIPHCIDSYFLLYTMYVESENVTGVMTL